MDFNDNQFPIKRPPFPVDHVHPWHKGSKVGSKEMDIAVFSPNLAGADGADAGFGDITASVDNTVGTPSVNVTTSGPNTAKNIGFAFHNLKGDKGDKGDTFEFSDLTQSQLDELRANITGFITKRYKFSYSDFSGTSSAKYVSFNPVFDTTGVKAHFVLLVFKNGLILEDNTEYLLADVRDGDANFDHWILTFNTASGHALPISGDIFDVIAITLNTPN